MHPTNCKISHATPQINRLVACDLWLVENQYSVPDWKFLCVVTLMFLTEFKSSLPVFKLHPHGAIRDCHTTHEWLNFFPNGVLDMKLLDKPGEQHVHF